MTASVGLLFDWTGGGFGSGANDDCTSLLMSYQGNRGGSPELTGSAQAGSATFVLLNPDGLFDPDNTSSPLYGLLRDGVRVWFGANEDGSLSGAGTPRGRFAGRVTDISPLPMAGAGTSTPTVEIVCEDALGWFARTQVALSVPAVASDFVPPLPPIAYGPLNSYSSASQSGYVIYNNTGFPHVPTVMTGAWSFGVLGTGGSADYFGDMTANGIRIFVDGGGGTLTVHTATYGGVVEYYAWTLRHWTGSAEVTDSSGTHLPTGSDIVITVPSDGWSQHIVDLTDDKTVSGGKLGYLGYSWAPG